MGPLHSFLLYIDINIVVCMDCMERNENIRDRLHTPLGGWMGGGGGEGGIALTPN